MRLTLKFNLSRAKHIVSVFASLIMDALLCVLYACVHACVYTCMLRIIEVDVVVGRES